MTIIPKLIFIDGIDRVGKDTIIREIHKKTKYKHVLVNRGPISYIAYHLIFNREFDPSEYMDLLTDETISIVLVADTEVLAKRFVETNEPDLPVSIEKAQNILKLVADRAAEKTSENVYLVEIEQLSPADLADKIINFVGL